MLMKYLSEYQPSRMRSMSSLNTEAGRRRRSKMVMPTWIIARGERTAGLVSCRPYGLLEGPSGYPGDRVPSVRLAFAAPAPRDAAGGPVRGDGRGRPAAGRGRARSGRSPRPARCGVEVPRRGGLARGLAREQ